MRASAASPRRTATSQSYPPPSRCSPDGRSLPRNCGFCHGRDAIGANAARISHVSRASGYCLRRFGSGDTRGPARAKRPHRTRAFPLQSPRDRSPRAIGAFIMITNHKTNAESLTRPAALRAESDVLRTSKRRGRSRQAIFRARFARRVLEMATRRSGDFLGIAKRLEGSSCLKRILYPALADAFAAIPDKSHGDPERRRDRSGRWPTATEFPRLRSRIRSWSLSSRFLRRTRSISVASDDPLQSQHVDQLGKYHKTNR